MSVLKRIGSAVLLSLLPLLLAGPALAAFNKSAETVLITGSNHGLGLELARQYAARGWNVIATARRPAGDPGLKALEAIRVAHPNLVIEQLDVTDSAMIKALAAKYKGQPIDVLLNNAAAVEPTFAADMAEVMKPYDRIDFDAARHDFDVNTLGPMRVVQAFAPNVIVSKGKRIATVTSMAGSFGAPMAGAMGMNYGASKAALNKYMTLLAVAVKPKGVLVGLFQPVFVATKDDVKAMQGAASVGPEVAKLIKCIDDMSPATDAKIVNFSTGKIDPY
ncbi:MAG TPA: SDR family NAD(P)-dependent oxidoreductase [Steroidobacteraceae bacterium]|jgi:NAD(P)-dependent dehydrogenase (short-subunit alcohol dehydrogenase family)|nr:SDR family NAD(P)-dependent oxidoreductase [Steroidobacteraceae bacterium]